MPSLSKTYRPQQFSDITGQDAIKETLRLEVQTGKTGHAYLFAGPRGVGKTTLARIFAKALNCQDRKDGEPCGACTACVEFASGKSMDFIEMDAASNTGVDNVREAIIEHVRFVPHARKFKVYVLDEAHMLSTSAWNALLKTIEEPPPYAIFIFVTTELHKVPATIQSRCQRFDFKRISPEALVIKMQAIAESEGVKIDPTVIQTIVSKSDGSARDAESLLGQLISLGEKDIGPELASIVLPLSRLPMAADLLYCWSGRNLGAALKSVEELEEQGIPLLSLFDDLIQAIRLLLLAADSAEWKKKLETGDEGEKALAKCVGVFMPEELADIALMLMERRRDAKQGADVRFCLELSATAVALGALPHGPKSDKSGQNNDRSGGAGGNVEKTSIQTKREEVSSTDPEGIPEPEIIPLNSVKTQEETAGTSYLLTLGQVLGKWPALLKAVDEKSPSLTFVLKISQPIKVENGLITIGFQYPFHKEKILGELKTKRLVEDCFRSVFASNEIHLDGVVGELTADGKEIKRDNVANFIKNFGGSVV
ncbi:DNA polymerase III subunit gamma/tau [Candidatus Uhrbacteria bacterium]|nr:DNA polymerase III subunit gamma/tau [Candidatus Uhrbacteria bacterium]